MGSPLRQPFFPSGEFVVRKNFTCQGKDYKTGDDFTGDKHGLDDARMRKFYNAGFIMLKPEKEEKAAKKKETVKVQKEEADEPTKTVKKEKKSEAKDTVKDKAQAKRDRAAARRANKKG